MVIGEVTNSKIAEIRLAFFSRSVSNKTSSSSMKRCSSSILRQIAKTIESRRLMIQTRKLSRTEIEDSDVLGGHDGRFNADVAVDGRGASAADNDGRVLSGDHSRLGVA